MRQFFAQRRKERKGEITDDSQEKTTDGAEKIIRTRMDADGTRIKDVEIKKSALYQRESAAKEKDSSDENGDLMERLVALEERMAAYQHSVKCMIEDVRGGSKYGEMVWANGRK